MKDKVKIILIAVIIIMAALLVINAIQANGKIKQLQSQVMVLNDMLDEKDKEMSKLVLNMQAKLKELESAKKEIEAVKTELSNTVIRLQSSTSAQPVAKN